MEIRYTASPRPLCTNFAMKRTIFIFFLLFVSISYGQNLIKPDTLINIPENIASLIQGQIKEVLSIDLDGNGQNDFIVIVDTEQRYKYEQYWFSSDLKLWIKQLWYEVGIEHIWFANLDEDPTLEVFYATGYEDGIDYYFSDFDLSSGQETVMFYFNPIIIENEKMYWGYPWDISDIKMSHDKGTQIYVSLEHDLDRLGAEIKRPENQQLFPVVFFSGHSTQPYDQSDLIRQPIWQSIESVGKAVHDKH